MAIVAHAGGRRGDRSETHGERPQTRQEPTSTEPEITLTYSDGAIHGASGCNRYHAGVTEGEQPGSLSIGPVAGTRMACPTEVMDLENRYLAALEGVTAYRFNAGRLVLSYQQGETHSSLIFVATEL